jgi:nitrogen fixation NifU-like protein
MYSEEVIEHFQNPRNVGVIENADGIGKVGNVICGDIMMITIKVGKNGKGERIIKDIKFKTMGCAAAIATSSMITELAKGKTFTEALKISREDIAGSLGGLPKIKLHCSVLATEALNEAIFDYLSKNNLPIPEKVQKKHEKIQKELEEIEKKYGDFIKEQKMFLDNKKN